MDYAYTFLTWKQYIVRLRTRQNASLGHMNGKEITVSCMDVTEEYTPLLTSLQLSSSYTSHKAAATLPSCGQNSLR